MCEHIRKYVEQLENENDALKIENGKSKSEMETFPVMRKELESENHILSNQLSQIISIASRLQNKGNYADHIEMTETGYTMVENKKSKKKKGKNHETNN